MSLVGAMASFSKPDVSVASNSASMSAMDYPRGNWFTRTFDPSGVEMAYNAYQADVARRFSASEAEKQRAWEKQMSDTAYSRAVKDLESIGVNPYAVGRIGSASTPSGAMATSGSAGIGGSTMGSSIVGGLFSLANSALDVAGASSRNNAQLANSAFQFAVGIATRFLR